MGGFNKERLKRLLFERISSYLELGDTSEPQSELIATIIEELRKRLGALIVDRHRLRKEVARLRNLPDSLTAKAESAIASGDDARARAVIAEKVDASRQLQDIANDLATIDEEIDYLENAIAQIRSAPKGGDIRQRIADAVEGA